MALVTLLLFAPCALAQYFSSSSSSFAPGASPTSNDNASNGNNNDDSGGGLNTYYAVGLALLLCCVALALFFMFRRRALEMRERRRNGGRTFALQRDLGGAVVAGDPAAGRGYLVGFRRPVESGPEEGLNERGEAPPQYISKREWEAAHGINNGGPDIPMQTLSHDAAGLPSKPPEYTETHTNEVDPNASVSTASGSGARPPGGGTNS